MKKAGLCFFFILVLTACNNHSTFIIHQAFDNHVDIQMKPVPEWTDPDEIKPILDQDFLSIRSWYDNKQVLYLRQKEDKNEVIKYHLLTGDEALFFESKYPITQIIPSSNNQYFLIEARGETNKSIITILDKNGSVIYKRIKTFDYAEYAWSPYQEEKCILSLYDSAAVEPEVLVLDLNHPQEEQILKVDPYIKWMGPDSIVYFDWGNDNALFASIMEYDLNTNKKSKVIDKAVAFATKEEHFMYANVNEDLTEITFYFMDSKSKEIYNKLSVPILNANAGYIWSPSFDWNEDTDTFITYAPVKAANFLEYNQGYNLLLYNTKSNEQKVILNSERNTNILLSPNGELCLIGERYSNLVNIKTNKQTNLLY